ncbi:kinase-like domain-containing protein, partial [Thelonectria olida]
VKSFGWYETETTIRIAMEHMANGDLRQYMNRPFADDEARKIAWQLAEALEFMHEAGFAHRDLKPANILVEERGPEWWVKIADFGICKRAEGTATALRTVIGTQGYIAPEVLGLILDDEVGESNSAFSYTRAVDMWALGEVIFRLRTQKPAFPNPGDLGRYAVQKKMLWVQPLRDRGASEECCDFIMRIMVADPRGRMTAAAAATHAWVKHSDSSGRSSPSPSSQ